MSDHNSTHESLPNIGELEDSPPNEYNVMFKDDLSEDRIQAHFRWMAQRFSAGPEGSRSYLNDSYTIGPGSRTTGYSVYMTPDHIQAIYDTGDIECIEPDYYTYCDGSSIVEQVDVPSWGLVRLSRRERLENDTDMVYYWDSEAAGEGVNAYVVDTGIFLEHEDFEGRASFGVSVYEGSSDGDTTGHGTHVAAIIGGKTYGVAKKAKLIGVKVTPDGRNRGQVSKLVKGLEWVARDAQKGADSPYPKCVVNISISSERSSFLNTHVKKLVESGLTVVVSAGNRMTDANNFSPASEPKAITVGATIRQEDGVWGRSNFGPALNIYAPGGTITSAWIPLRGGTETNGRHVMSGTSQAAPHIAGIAACIVSSDSFTGGPKEVRARIETWGLKGKILRVMRDTVNLLANNGVPQLDS